MAEDIKFKFQTHIHCSQQKTQPTQAAYLGNTQSSKIWEQVCADFLFLELERKRSGDLLWSSASGPYAQADEESTQSYPVLEEKGFPHVSFLFGSTQIKRGGSYKKCSLNLVTKV